MFKNKRIILWAPFIILGLIVLYTWFKILTTEYFATLKHQIALGLFLLNFVLYTFRFKYGVLLTGVILVLATFNQIAIYPDIESTSFFIKIAGAEFATPSIQWKTFFLFILYLFIVISVWRDIFGKKME